MLLVRQPMGSYLCVAACVAMITGRTVKDLCEEHGWDVTDSGMKWWSLERAFIALVKEGWGPVFFDQKPDRVILHDCVALVGVESETVKLKDGTAALHSVVWHKDGYILDPQKDGRHLVDDYVVIDWCPLMPFTQEGELV